MSLVEDEDQPDPAAQVARRMFGAVLGALVVTFGVAGVRDYLRKLAENETYWAPFEQQEAMLRAAEQALERREGDKGN